MPFLKDVPNIHKFRNLPKHKININLVNNEIILFGGYLTQGQILYRGGNFQAKDTTIDNDPISTSIMPSVARWHAIKVSGEIAMLEIAESNITRAFAFKTKGNQRLKDEYEVLLQNSLRLEYVKTSNHNNMQIHEFKVYAIT